jgi:hypothetical protein
VLNCLYQSINPKKPNWRETMKKMKAFCTATVLALTLSVSAFAGDIATPGTAQPGGTATPSSVATAPLVTNSDPGVLGDVLLALLAMF